MPYIQIRTNKEISEDKEIEIKKRLGDAISIVGKSEQWLMVEFVSNCHLYFRGSKEEDIAYVSINLYGRSNAYNEMTSEVSKILNDSLGISLSNIYISYMEYENWGWNGRNF